MNYEDFKTKLLNALNEQTATNEHITAFEVSSSMKTNENTKDSIVPRYDDNKGTSPCYYPEELYEDYENGRSMDDIVDSVIGQSEYSYIHTPSVAIGDLSSDTVKNNLYLQLINGDTNPLIKNNCAHIEMNDLIAVPRCKIEIDGQIGSYLVNHKIQYEMKLTDDELLAIARKNTMEQPYTIKAMAEVLGESLGMNLPIEGIPQIYVLSSENGINGSVHMINTKAMSEASELMNGENLFIIPSSIFEVLLLPESMVEDPAHLHVMCNEINDTVVKNSEVLSGSIYRYDHDTQKISICNNLNDLQKLQNSAEQHHMNQHRQSM